MTYPAPVIIRFKLVRKVIHVPLLALKVWAHQPIPKTCGWIIQKATLSNGARIIDEGYVSFRHHGSFTAYKVAIGMRRAPVWVHVEDVEFVEVKS